MNVETASRLVALRKKKGLSQEELAEKIGVSRQSISKWERAESSPDTDNLIALANVYGLRIDDMLNKDIDHSADFDQDTYGNMHQNESNFRATMRRFPYPVLCVIVFLLWGFLWDGWYISWIVFLTVPLWAALVGKSPEEEKKDAEKAARKAARRKARQAKRDNWLDE